MTTLISEEARLEALKLEATTTLWTTLDIDSIVGFTPGKNLNRLNARIFNQEEEQQYKNSYARTIHEEDEFLKAGGRIVKVSTADMHPEDHYFFISNQSELTLRRLEVVKAALVKDGKTDDAKAYDKLETALKAENADFNAIKKDKSLEEAINKVASLYQMDISGDHAKDIYVPAPQLYVRYDDKGAPILEGVEVGGKYFAASIDEKGQITIRDASTDKELKALTHNQPTISTWPTHCETLDQQLYPTDWTLEGALNKSFQNYATRTNDAITRMYGVIKTTSPATDTTYVKDGIAIDISQSEDGKRKDIVMGKGVNKDAENYSPFRAESKGINKAPTQAYLKELLIQIKNKNNPSDQDITNLKIVGKGIAYDYCLSNTSKDVMSFIVPALRVMVAAERGGKPLDITLVVGKLAEIVAQRIKDGKDVTAAIPATELAKAVGLDPKLLEAHKIGVTMDIPKGAFISIAAPVNDVRVHEEMQAISKAADVTIEDGNKEAVDKLVLAKMTTQFQGILKSPAEIVKAGGINLNGQEKVFENLAAYSKASDETKTRFAWYQMHKDPAFFAKDPSKLTPRETLDFNANYLTFIIQETAASAALEKNPDKTAILDTWRQQRQIAFNDGGNNITIENLELPVISIRADGKLGATAGGLADVIMPKQIELLVVERDAAINAASGKHNDPTVVTLSKKLFMADNVACTIGTNGQLSYRAIDPATDQIDIITNTKLRESMEEMGETLFNKYIYAQKEATTNKSPHVSLVDIIYPKGTKIGDKIASDKDAQAIFGRMEDVFDQCVQDKDGTKRGETYKKIYEGQIEPLIAEFIKTTPTGKDITAEMRTAVEHATGNITSDEQWPNKILVRAANVAAGKEMVGNRPLTKDEFLEQVAAGTLNKFPVSQSSIVSFDKNSMLGEFFNRSIETSLDAKRNPETAKSGYLFETGGILDLTAEASKLGANKSPEAYGLAQAIAGLYEYPHEGVNGIQLYMTRGFKEAKGKNADIKPEEFAKNFFSEAISMVPDAVKAYKERATAAKKTPADISQQFDPNKFNEMLGALVKNNYTTLDGKTPRTAEAILGDIFEKAGLKGIDAKAFMAELAKEHAPTTAAVVQPTAAKSATVDNAASAVEPVAVTNTRKAHEALQTNLQRVFDNKIESNDTQDVKKQKVTAQNNAIDEVIQKARHDKKLYKIKEVDGEAYDKDKHANLPGNCTIVWQHPDPAKATDTAYDITYTIVDGKTTDVKYGDKAHALVMQKADADKGKNANVEMNSEIGKSTITSPKDLDSHLNPILKQVMKIEEESAAARKAATGETSFTANVNKEREKNKQNKNPQETNVDANSTNRKWSLSSMLNRGDKKGGKGLGGE